ncbi:MAG: LysM peptidoglycan-binding domain-containing protein [Spirochaetales bacterium]|nr:LysM peptidoglycan-binding domain-containing protein [Spirochaetales bacterium]
MNKKLQKILCIIFLIFFIVWSATGETIVKPGSWHTIRWGETLIEIARHYSIEPSRVAKANNIFDWNTIYAGSTLWIPGNEMIKVYIYKVKKGDTLADIAQQFNIDMWEIAGLNNIYNMNLIFENQTLYIPVSK